MRGRALVAAAVVLVASGGAVTAAFARGAPPELAARGPATVSAGTASAVFTIGERTVRQVRYVDGATLAYTFDLANTGDRAAEVTARAGDQPGSRLFSFVSLLDGTGADDFTLDGGGTRQVTLALEMGGCETLSSRSGSFVEAVVLRVDGAPVEVELPEHLHSGSPREASCPGATASSRPQG